MANFRLLGIMTVVLLMAVCGPAQCSVEIIQDLGTSGFTSNDISATFPGTGFVTVLQKTKDIRNPARGEVQLFVRAFGLSAGTLPVATLMQVDISKYQGQKINSAFLEFDLGGGSRDPSKLTITSFDANGTLGFLWNPAALGTTVVADISGVPKHRIEVTQLLKDRLASGKTWLGLHMTADSGTLVKPTLGRLGPDAAQVRLDVEVAHAPEPSTLAIWSILGVAMVAGRRRLFG